jgi:hypothetical protein
MLEKKKEKSTLPLETQLQSILFWLFWKWGGLMNYLHGLALNHDFPDFSLPSS